VRQELEDKINKLTEEMKMAPDEAKKLEIYD
jgi:hypothetical protein